MIAVFDVESSCTELSDLDPASPSQPYVCAVAAALYDEDREIMSAQLIVRPDGWKIAADMTAIHGITTERASEVGISIQAALAAIVGITANAPTLVCFGLSYNERRIQAELARLKRTTIWPHAGQDRVCVMALATDACKIPHPKREGQFKLPKLSEASRIILGQEHAGDCLADARAAYAIYRKLAA
ncbi:MAG: hypothetical protein AB7F96_15450 [Beijerinckiaceae bacterium]